jgi:hypothetical protein
VLAAVAIGFHLSSGNGRDKPVVNAADQTFTDSTISEKNIGSSGTIAIPGFNQITMKAGQTAQRVELYNPKQNTCYMVITIMLPDKTQLYKSGMLEPGKVINTIELSRKLEAGTYKGAILRYSCYALENMKELNGAETIFTLEVKP